MSALSIRQCTRGYAVFRGRSRASGIFTSLGLAEDRVCEIETLERYTERPCITCRTPIQSEGPHHRMCATCRQRGSNGMNDASSGGVHKASSRRAV